MEHEELLIKGAHTQLSKSIMHIINSHIRYTMQQNLSISTEFLMESYW